jgi:lipid II:glycine glycyltransferase (peptidoglycan interpeptide bridge formation enzyme)
VTALADYLEVVRQTRDAGLLSGILARFESEVLADMGDLVALRAAGLVRANRDPGMKSTILVDLSSSEEVVLAGFSQSARRNIRKAEAARVVAEPVIGTADDLETMFELMKATEARAHYGLRPKTYFLDYWRSQIGAGQAQLFLARHEGEVLAGLFATYLDHRAWYKDGGSFDKLREVQAPYLLQWRVMQWLRSRGVTAYDLVGTPNRDKVGTGDPKDGLYTFKSKFNPEITEFVGCYDLPLGGSLRYAAWLKLGERVAARLANRAPEKWLY